MKKNAYMRARHMAESSSPSAQELNRQWWEKLPMTYVDWEKDNRLPINFDELEQTFLQSNPWLADNMDFSKWNGAKVLEIGCGSGVASCLFAKAHADVVAIDLTEMATTLTQMNALAQNLDIEVLTMDAENITFESESFDFVFSWGVLHHSHNPLRAFTEISRLLRPNGKGLIMVYNKNSLRYFLKGLYWLIVKRKIFSGDSLETVQRYFTDGYYHKHFTPAELSSALANAGLKTKNISISHMAKKMIPFIPIKLDNYLKKTMDWLLIIEFAKEHP